MIVLLIMISIPVSMVILWHLYKTKFFPWIERKSDAYPVVQDYIINNEYVKNYVGDIFLVNPIFNTIASRYSHNKPIDGRYYIGQICNFKIKVQGSKEDTFIHIEVKEKGLETRNFVVVEAFIKDVYYFEWLLKPEISK